MLGTPAYMAPEMFEGRVIDHRADLYAIGIMAYQLLCRRVPFSASNLTELCEQHRSEPIIFSDTDREQPARLASTRHQKAMCKACRPIAIGSAATFIESVNRQGGLAYEVETEQTRGKATCCRAVSSDASTSSVDSRNSCARRIGARGCALRAPAMCVVGPSGIGKSRLMNQVRQQLQLQGTSFIESSCLENAFDEYGPVADLINHAARLVTAAGGASNHRTIRARAYESGAGTARPRIHSSRHH